MDPIVSGGGNTISPPKRSSLAKNWCFTYNNYMENSLDLICKSFDSDKSLNSRYIIGKEIGESGTPHLQGFITCAKKIRPIERFKLNKSIHWESARGSIEDNIAYCSKDGDFICKGLEVESEDEEVELYGWQLDVLDLVKGKRDKRIINWFWESKGSFGKSALVRYLAINHNALVCSGKCSDIKYSIVKYREKSGVYPKIVIFDIPRASLNYISYTGIEEIKNGVFASSKYECDMVVMKHPHILCFANEPPKKEELSKDRWCIKSLRNETTIFEDLDSGLSD